MARDVPLRRWYRVHLLTLLVMALLAGLLVWCNRYNVDPYEGEQVSLSISPPLNVNPKGVEVMPMGNFNIKLEGFTHGWPLRYEDYCVQTIDWPPQSKQPPVVEKTVLRDSRDALTANILVAVTMVLAVGLLVERWLRRGLAIQFGLRGLLVGTAVVAVGLSLWRIHGRLETAFDQENLVSRIFEFPPYAYVPVLIALGLTVYALFSLVAWILFGLLGLAARMRAGSVE